MYNMYVFAAILAEICIHLLTAVQKEREKSDTKEINFTEKRRFMRLLSFRIKISFEFTFNDNESDPSEE